jgi:hypothetical protein
MTCTNWPKNGIKISLYGLAQFDCFVGAPYDLLSLMLTACPLPLGLLPWRLMFDLLFSLQNHLIQSSFYVLFLSQQTLNQAPSFKSLAQLKNEECLPLTLNPSLYFTFSHLFALNCVPISTSKAPRRCAPLSWAPHNT